MSEIDLKVLEGLRALAANSPEQARAHVEERLLSEFRRRSRARLRNRWLAVAGGAIAAGIAVFIWMRLAPAKLPSEPLASVPSQVHKALVSRPAPPPRKIAVSPSGQTPAVEVAMNFYRLPDADILPPLDSAVIVRVRLPISSLRLMGVAVNEDRASESVQADLLLGQDGLARGVRFIN
jgi:hypothetical protein